MWNTILPHYSFLLICGYFSISIADYSFAWLRAFSIIFQLYHTNYFHGGCVIPDYLQWANDNYNPNIMSVKFNWWLSMIPRISMKRTTISNLKYLVGIRVAHLFGFLCCVLALFVPVSCAPYDASFTELLIPDCPFVFL